MADQYRFSTLCAHAGEGGDIPGSPHTPFYNSTTFRLEDNAGQGI